MAYSTKHTIAHPRMAWCSVEFRVSARDNDPRHEESYGDVATLNLHTGMADVQFYATAEALRALAGSLNNAAQALEMAAAGKEAA